MSWPTDDITTTHLDAATDDPSQARAELYTVAQRVKGVIAGRGTTSGVCDLDSSGYVPSSRLTSSLITTALGYTPWHSGNDGAGSTLDADLLDGSQGADYLLKAGGTMTGAIAMGNYAISGIKTAAFNAEHDIGNSSTAATMTLTNGQKQKVTLTDDCTLTITTTSAGVGHYQLKLIQDGTGSRVVTWSGISSTNWLGSADAPSINAAASSLTIISLYFDGSTVYGSASKVGAA